MSMLRQLMRSQRRSLARSISLAARAKQLAAPRGFRGPRNLSAPHAHPPDRSWPGRTPAKRLFSESSKQNSKKQSSSSVSGGSDKGTAKDSTAAAATPAGSSKMSSSQSKKVPHVHTHSGPADLSVLAYLENAGLKISPEVAESVQRLVTLRIRNVSSDVRRRYLIAGIAGGVVLLAGGLYLALGGDVIEYLIATQALLRFNSADSFADRVAVYHSIPDINVPVPLDPSEHELKNMINTDSPLLLTWLESVESAISSLERSHLLEVRERVRHRLIKEALEMAQLHERVAAIQAVLNPCAEKEALLERELNREFEKGGSGWIDADILEAVCNTDDGGGAQLLGNRLQARELKTRLLITAISFYPASLRDLLHFILKPLSEDEMAQLAEDAARRNGDGDGGHQHVAAVAASGSTSAFREKVPVVSHNAGSIPDDDMGAPMRRLEEHILTALLRNSNDDPKTAKGRSAKKRRLHYREQLHHSLGFIRHHFQSLSPRMQAFVLQKAVTNTIRIIPQLTQKKILMQKEERQEKHENAGSSQNVSRAVEPSLDGHALEGVDGGAAKAGSHPDDTKDETALDMYVRVIDYNLLAPLRQDARISEDILSQVRQIFLALPAGIQARVLLTGIRHVVEKDLAAEAAAEEEEEEEERHRRVSDAVTTTGDAEASASPEQLVAAENGNESSPEQRDSALLAKKLLSAGGVVAVKLAQMLAEDPKIPREYRELLGSLRDRNETMSPSDFWRQLPSSVRDRISFLGKCLGTGSVKQVHIARGDFDDTYVGFLRQPFRKSESDREGQPEESSKVAVGVLRQHVEDEALSSLEALLLSKELATIASRLARLVYGEFSLFQEGESLKDIAGTPIGLHPSIDVVSVKHNSPRCLVMSVGSGPTASEVMKVFDHAAKLRGEAQSDRDVLEIMGLLEQFHRTVFEAFVQDGIIHSDVHLGNMIYGRSASKQQQQRRGGGVGGEAPTASSECNKEEEEQQQADEDSAGTTTEPRLVLFDVGQFERVSPPETLAILWTLVALSDNTRRRTLRDIAMKHLSECSTVNPAFLKQSSDCAVGEAEVVKAQELNDKWLRKTLCESFEAAIEPLSDGTIPDKKLAYMLFLREAESRGASVPKACFAVAKMIDGIVSQQDSFGLYPVFEEAAEEFLKSKITWGETFAIARKYFL